jgi:hypothetical protein
MNLRHLMEECADAAMRGDAPSELIRRASSLAEDDAARVMAFVEGARYAGRNLGTLRSPRAGIMPGFYKRAKREAPYIAGGLMFAGMLLLIVWIFTLRFTPARAAEASPPSSAEAASAPEGR